VRNINCAIAYCEWKKTTRAPKKNFVKQQTLFEGELLVCLRKSEPYTVRTLLHFSLQRVYSCLCPGSLTQLARITRRAQVPILAVLHCTKSIQHVFHRGSIHHELIYKQENTVQF